MRLYGSSMSVSREGGYVRPVYFSGVCGCIDCEAAVSEGGIRSSGGRVGPLRATTARWFLRYSRRSGDFGIVPRVAQLQKASRAPACRAVFGGPGSRSLRRVSVSLPDHVTVARATKSCATGSCGCVLLQCPAALLWEVGTTEARGDSGAPLEAVSRDRRALRPR